MYLTETNPIDRRRCRERGFTIVEIVIVVFLAAVFAMLAGPFMRDFVIQQNIRNAAFDLMSDITYARSEAVKRNTTVTVAKATTWTNGWTVAAGATTLRQHPAVASSIAITMGGPSIDFYLNGRASSLSQFTIEDTGGSTSIKARCVSIDPSGRPQSVEGSCS